MATSPPLITPASDVMMKKITMPHRERERKWGLQYFHASGEWCCEEATFSLLATDKRGESMEKNTQASRDSREPWRYCGRSFLGGAGRDHLCGGFSWPPRSYTCSFCRKEFRSAQALGGHMNVHRRDRARLRQSPPWDPPPPPSNHNPNASSVPNLNMPPPSWCVTDANKHSPALYTFHSLLSPVEDAGKSAMAVKVRHEWRSLKEDEGERGKEMVVAREETDILDLELRLGYP